MASIWKSIARRVFKLRLQFRNSLLHSQIRMNEESWLGLKKVIKRTEYQNWIMGSIPTRHSGLWYHTEHMVEVIRLSAITGLTKDNTIKTISFVELCTLTRYTKSSWNLAITENLDELILINDAQHNIATTSIKFQNSLHIAA